MRDRLGQGCFTPDDFAVELLEAMECLLCAHVMVAGPQVPLQLACVQESKTKECLRLCQLSGVPDLPQDCIPFYSRADFNMFALRSAQACVEDKAYYDVVEYSAHAVPPPAVFFDIGYQKNYYVFKPVFCKDFNCNKLGLYKTRGKFVACAGNAWKYYLTNTTNLEVQAVGYSSGVFFLGNRMTDEQVLGRHDGQDYVFYLRASRVTQGFFMGWRITGRGGRRSLG